LLTISPVFLTHFCDSPLYFALLTGESAPHDIGGM
jgi:hypothetical protein